MQFGDLPLADAEGAILAHSVKHDGGMFKKGRTLTVDDIALLAASGVRHVFAAKLGKDDVPEDEAAAAVARLVGAEGTKAQAPFTGRANLYAACHGLAIVDVDRVRALLDRFPDHALVPIVSTIHRMAREERDNEGFRRFHATFCPERRVIAPELADPDVWRAELTPQRLKGIIARLDVLISQRKHNAIHAIGAGVPVIGIHVARDDSLPRCIQALADCLPEGSACIALQDPD